MKASLRSSNRKSNCRVGAEADSEIPELGLDSGRLNIDCDVNPLRVAGAAFRAAKHYNSYRQANRPHGSSPMAVKRKRTRLTLDREYERSNDGQRPTWHQHEQSSNNDDDEDDDDD